MREKVAVGNQQSCSLRANHEQGCSRVSPAQRHEMVTVTCEQVLRMSRLNCSDGFDCRPAIMWMR